MTVQNILTIAIEAIAIIGFGGIILHALYNAIKPTLELGKGFNPDEWTQEQIEWSKQVVEAHKASLAASSYEYACPLTCELPQIEQPIIEAVTVDEVVQPKAKRTRKSSKKQEVSAETPVEKVSKPRKPRAKKAA